LLFVGCLGGRLLRYAIFDFRFEIFDLKGAAVPLPFNRKSKI